MSASSVLLVAASIVAVESGRATIDVGSSQLLEPGDLGQAFYELIVDGAPKRIEAGPVTVMATDETSAIVTSNSGAPLRAGFRVELALPGDRAPMTPGRLAAAPGKPPKSDIEASKPRAPAPVVSEPVLAGSNEPKDPEKLPVSRPLREIPPSPPQQEPARPVPDDYPEHTLPAVPVVPEPADPVPDESDEPDVVPPPVQEPEDEDSPDPERGFLEFSTGSFSIGLDPSEAQFFNQTPRHEVELTAFSIDRFPVGEGLVPSSDADAKTGLAYSEALSYCQRQGLRLPTEQEWEVAAQSPDFVALPGIYEWTSSWYRAYPGNSKREEEYRAGHRVLRGVADGSAESLYVRRFMDPGENNSKVGFRCVRDSR